MPWRNRGYSYNENSISKRAPSASGVYAIFREGLWIYIGETDDIRGRLFAHLKGDNQCIRKYRPTGFSFELCAPGERTARYHELVSDLSPPCNCIFSRERRPVGRWRRFFNSKVLWF